MFDCPNNSSHDTGKKRRWPPQHVSSPPAPQTKRLRFQTSPTRQQPSAASASPVIDLDRTVSPAAGRPRASGRAYTHMPGSYTMKNLFPEMPIQYQSVSPKGAKPPAPIVCPDQPPDPKATTRKNIISLFFLLYESLGAVPTSISQCHTWAFFFNQALSAWNLLRGSARNGDLAAVSVNLESAQWQIVLPWGNMQAHKSMIDMAVKACAESNG